MSEQTDNPSPEVVHIAKSIVAVPMNTGQRTLKELRDAGFIPIQTSDPESVKLITPETEGSDLLLSAMHGLTNSGYESGPHRKAFLNELYRRLLCVDSTARASGAPGRQAIADPRASGGSRKSDNLPTRPQGDSGPPAGAPVPAVGLGLGKQ